MIYQVIRSKSSHEALKCDLEYTTRAIVLAINYHAGFTITDTSLFHKFKSRFFVIDRMVDFYLILYSCLTDTKDKFCYMNLMDLQYNSSKFVTRV